MARPVNANAEATKSRIVQSALSLFSARGFGEATIRDVAKGAGVSLAMVHHYFMSKEQLYDACIQVMLDELRQLSIRLTEDLSGKSPRQVIERAIRVGFRFACDHRTAVRLLQRSLIDQGRVDAKVFQGSVLPFLDLLSGLLAGQMQRPAQELRLPLQSAIFLVSRYAISANDEVVSLVATGATNEEGAYQGVEDHLVEAIMGMLRIGDASAQ